MCRVLMGEVANAMVGPLRLRASAKSRASPTQPSIGSHPPARVKPTVSELFKTRLLSPRPSTLHHVTPGSNLHFRRQIPSNWTLCSQRNPTPHKIPATPFHAVSTAPQAPAHHAPDPNSPTRSGRHTGGGGNHICIEAKKRRGGTDVDLSKALGQRECL